MIDRMSSVPVYRQLYECLRSAILGGRLAPGTRVPATRALAHRLGVARTTVLTAYDQLVADGYLESRVGAWTSVARNLPRDLTPDPKRPGERVVPKTNDNAAWVVDPFIINKGPEYGELAYDFRGIVPALDAFPVHEWARLVSERWHSMTPHSMVEFPQAGDLALRHAITDYVRTTRGIECDVEQVIITTGSEQAIDILLKIILTPGDRVAIEEPSHPLVRNVFRAHGAELVPVPVDKDGLVVDALSTMEGRSPSLVYLTPTHQYPTGTMLSLARRIDLLRWAATRRVLVFEDDYHSELSYEGASLEALHALDAAGVVAYLGTFTKVLNPSIQISYLIAPRSLVMAATAAQRIIARQSDVIHQAVLAKFIRRGDLSRHLRRLRRIHIARRDALVGALRDHFGESVIIGPARTGLHVHVRWPHHPITAEQLDRFRAVGVGVMPVRPMYVRAPEFDPGVVMTFASLTERQITDGIAALAAALRIPASR